MREDDLREDQHRRDGIDEEVEEFRRPPDDDANRDLALADGMVVRMDVARVPLEARGVQGRLPFGIGDHFALISTSRSPAMEPMLA